MEASQQKLNIIVGASGSIASVKLCKLVQLLKEGQRIGKISLAISRSAQHFINQSDLEAIVDEKNKEKVCLLPELSTQKELSPAEWKSVDKTVQENDILLIAPLSANTLAKISIGMTDNLLVKKSLF